MVQMLRTVNKRLPKMFILTKLSDGNYFYGTATVCVFLLDLDFFTWKINVKNNSFVSSQPHFFFLVFLMISFLKVGLPSSRHHSTFEISETSPDEGALVLLRRCQSATCEGHCTCAPVHLTCSTAQGLCSDLTRGKSTQNLSSANLTVQLLNFS